MTALENTPGGGAASERPHTPSWSPSACAARPAHGSHSPPSAPARALPKGVSGSVMAARREGCGVQRGGAELQIRQSGVRQGAAAGSARDGAETATTVEAEQRWMERGRRKAASAKPLCARLLSPPSGKKGRRAASARRGAAAARAASASRLREPLGPVLKSAVRGRLLGRHTGSGDRIAPASARHAAGCRSRRRSTKPRRSTPHRRTGQGEDGSRTSTRGSRDVERPPTTTLAQHGLTSMPSELRDLHAVGAIMRQRRVAEALTCGLLQRSAPLRRPRRGLRLIF
jgi:hypothetical protein